MATTWLYIAWALLPVLLAILFSFNADRSRSVWQGFSTRWWWGDPVQSVFHDPDYSSALLQSLRLAALDMVIATPWVSFWRWVWRGGGGAARGRRTCSCSFRW